MTLTRLGISRIVTLLVALLMVAAGIILSRSTGGRGAAAAQTASTPVRVSPASLVAPAAAPVTHPSASQHASSEEFVGPPTPRPVAAKSAAAEPASPQVPAPAPASRIRAPRATSNMPLPPLSPDFAALGSAHPSGPPPNLLWLSGVIQGDPPVALLRRGDKRYVVREGGTFEGYRVTRIGTNTATIQRGARTQTLRVGKR